MFDGSITMSYRATDIPIRTVGCVNKQRTHLKARRSSSLLNTEGPGFLSEPTNFESSSQANTVGVLGGASAVSTLNFLEKVVRWSSADGQDSLPFIACNDPVLSKELSSYERSFPSYVNSRNRHYQFDQSLIVERLRQKRLLLERSGARCIVMPCHLSHVWHKEVSDGCSVTFLHVGECVAKELKAANLKPIEAGSSLRIGVLATEAVLTAGFYQEQLQNQGFEVLVPDKATMEHTVVPAIKAFERKDMEGAKNLLRISLQVLVVRAVNTVILASDEMLGLLPLGDPLLKKCTNPMDALVRATIQWAKSSPKAKQ